MASSKSVTACVLIIGNEILSGRTQDINLNYISKTLGKWGIQVREARVIPDVEETIIETLNSVRKHFDYVFTTGGIGPTHDDITAACIAKAFNKPVVRHPDIEARINTRPAPPEVMESRLLMARVPEGAELIDNPTGGPQGFFIENVYVMAGIPRVMQAMLASLEGSLNSGDVVHSFSIRAYLGESQISEPLGKVQDEFSDLDIGSYPFLAEDRYGTMLVIRGTNLEDIQNAADAIKEIILSGGESPEILGFEQNA